MFQTLKIEHFNIENTHCKDFILPTVGVKILFN